MAIRHLIAVNCLQTNDLFQLSEMLKDAVKNAIDDKSDPIRDPAINIICHQVAFAGNGDHPFLKYYKESYDYCMAQIQRDQHGLPEKDDEKPIYSGS